MRRLSNVIIALFLGVVGASPCLAQTVSLQPTKDNTMYSEGDSSNGKGLYLFSGVTNISNERRALLHFDLSGFVSPDSVLSAQLQLYMSKTNNGTQTVNLYRLIRDWGEGKSDAIFEEGGGATALAGDATWNYAFYDTSAWTAPGGDFDTASTATFQVTNIGSYNCTDAQVLADVKYWIENPNLNFGWIVIIKKKQGSSKRFNSKDNPENPPTLILQGPGTGTTSLNTTSAENIVVYPNPTHGNLIVRANQGMQINSLQVLDILGRKVEFSTRNGTGNNGSNMNIDLSKKGAYFVVINHTIYRRVIVL